MCQLLQRLSWQYTCSNEKSCGILKCQDQINCVQDTNNSDWNNHTRHRELITLAELQVCILLFSLPQLMILNCLAGLLLAEFMGIAPFPNQTFGGVVGN